MVGKIIAGFIVVSALIIGALTYYFQVHYYYEAVAEPVGAYEIQMTSLVSGQPEEILVESFQGIDASSAPVRFRGCFTTPLSLSILTETFVIFDKAEPRTGPNWFDCYDAKAIGAALESGEAIGFMGQENFTDGFDRVIAVYPDGRAFVWHQPNEKYEE
ncbi:hypothetical protein RB2150_05288 [Rhodobacterales bacterium HTCC2150]|nr:hypothetical protein RB2150_05288 [Rhodobacterales bacterium HTCC2150] [Rhodobacteraceae bacterium HTCC2150]